MKRLIPLALLFLTTIISLCSSAQQNIFKPRFSNNGSIRFQQFNGSVNRVPVDKVYSFLREKLKMREGDSLHLDREIRDDDGNIHKCYSQYYKGIRVEYADYKVHIKNGVVESINGGFAIVGNPSINASITPRQAIAFAKRGGSGVGGEIKMQNADTGNAYLSKEGFVIFYDYSTTKKYRLAYKIDVYTRKPLSHNFIFVDALNGKILGKQNLILDENSKGQGSTLYSGTQHFITDSYADSTGKGYRLREVRNGVIIQTLNMQNTVNLGTFTDFSDDDNNWQAAEHSANKDNAALDAHFAQEFVYDYFNTKQHRNSWNNAGDTLTAFVHFDSAWDNAYWDRQQQAAFFGDGRITNNAMTCLDIVGHEFGHAYTQGVNIDNPILADESYHETLALNEGFSDIWGAVIENFANIPAKQIWLHGHDAKIDGYPSDRSLANPTKDGDPTESSTGGYPDTYHGQYWDIATYDAHINSTVLSHWFYLISVGDTIRTIPAIGIDDAAYIAWQTELLYLSPGSEYADAYTYTIKVAVDHWGVNSCQAIAAINAWHAVGIGDAYENAVTGPAAICSTGGQYTLLKNDGKQTVTWQVSPAGVTDASSGTGNTFTLAQKGRSTGVVNLAADYCGVQFTLPVTVGAPVPPAICAPATLCYKDAKDTAKVCPTYDGIVYEWQIDSISAGTGTAIQLNPNNIDIGTHIIRVRVDACGGEAFSAWRTDTFVINNCVTGSTIFTISPNPASQFVNISIVTPVTFAGTKNVRIYDALGKLRKQAVYTSQQQNIRISVADLAQGTYFAELSDGVTTVRKKIIIAR